MFLKASMGLLALTVMLTVSACSTKPEPEAGGAINSRLAQLAQDGGSIELGDMVEGEWDSAAFFFEGATPEQVNPVVGVDALSDRYTDSTVLLVVVRADEVRLVRVTTPALTTSSVGRAVGPTATISAPDGGGRLTVE